jgi:hypothetical protein
MYARFPLSGHNALGFGALPYIGPYQVLSRREKTLQLLMHGRPVMVSTSGVKLAYILSGTDRGNNSFNRPVDATPAAAPPATLPQSIT